MLLSYYLDPSFGPPKSPENLEQEVQALRRQLEEIRALSAKYESERLRQASDIQRLTDEVR